MENSEEIEQNWRSKLSKAKKFTDIKNNRDKEGMNHET